MCIMANLQLTSGLFNWSLNINDKAREYAGSLDQTVSETPCQRWDSQSPHPHPFNGLKQVVAFIYSWT